MLARRRRGDAVQRPQGGEGLLEHGPRLLSGAGRRSGLVVGACHVGDFVDALAKADGKTLQQTEAEFFTHVRPSSLIRRFATTEEVASLVTYLASPLASATTGSALRVDGGVVRSAF